MDKPKSENITWHEANVDAAARELMTGQRGAVVWLTGLSGSGKSTIARLVEEQLLKRGRIAYVLDGDNVRHGLNADLGFSAEDRQENIRRIGEVAALFAEAGVLVITAFISPYRRDRDRARQAAPAGRFLEVHLDVPVAVCEQRDPKGLYRKARAGEITDFTGVDAPYEAPTSPELKIDTAELEPGAAAAAVLRLVEEALGPAAAADTEKAP